MTKSKVAQGGPQNHHGDIKGKTVSEKTMACSDAREEAITAMLINWPWYGHFSMGMSTIETEEVPIAACGWDPKTGQGTLYFNPTNFGKFDLKTRIFAIVHEITHWINLHCHSTYRGKLVNIAMDMAVNSMLASFRPSLTPTNPEEFITVNGVWHQYAMLEPNLKCPPEKQSWEWYYNWLLDRKKNIQSKLEQLLDQLGLSQGDGGDGDNLAEGVAPGLGDKVTDHSNWDNMTEAEKDLVKQYVNSAAERSSQCARPPGELAGTLEGLIESCKPKVNWEKYLKNFIGTCGNVDVEVTRSRHNKYGEPGKVTLLPTGECIVAQDTSGSVPNEELAQFWGAVEDISKRLSVQTYVMQVDAKVHSFEKFKHRPNKTGYEVKGRGGTDMVEIFRYLNDHPEIKSKTLVVLTDGWTPYPEPKDLRGRKVLWVITAKDMVAKVPPGIGTAIWLDVKQRQEGSV
jgi:predicted metal-dependent peptidase